MTKLLNRDMSQFTRPGPNRILRPALPYVYGAGVVKALGSNHFCSVLGYVTCPATSGRLPVPVLVVDVWSTGENGSPLCIVRMPLVCHPPRIQFTGPS